MYYTSIQSILFYLYHVRMWLSFVVVAKLPLHFPDVELKIKKRPYLCVKIPAIIEEPNSYIAETSSSAL